MIEEKHLNEIHLLISENFALWESIVLVSEIHHVDADELRAAYDDLENIEGINQ
jgi:hypothetical protein